MISLSLCVESQVISFPINWSLGYIEFFAYVGKSETPKYFQLSIDVPFSWSASFFHSLEEGDSIKLIKNESISLHGQELKASLFKTQLLITAPTTTGVRIKEFYYYFVHEKLNFSVTDSISLALNYKNDSFNIVNYLYNSNLIKSQTFSITISEKYQVGKISFGGVPDVVNKTYPYRSKVFVDQSRPSWGAELKKVRVGDFIYDKRDEFYLFTNRKGIYAPDSFMNFFNHVYGDQLIKEGKCEYRSTRKWEKLVCLCREIENLKISFDFYLGETPFYFTKDELFPKFADFSNECTFQVEKNLMDSRGWAFGIQLLLKYPSLFDYSNKSITFFSKEKFEVKDTHEKIYVRKTLLKGVSIVLLISCIILLVSSKEKIQL